jgi:hypothetical protein
MYVTVEESKEKPPVKVEGTISFAGFLEGIPPSQSRAVSELTFRKNAQYLRQPREPQLLLHCSSDICNGLRAYKAETPCMMVDHILTEVAHLIGYRG